jgi:hypothetical protein
MRITCPIAGSIKVLDTSGKRKGVSLQNISAVDIYYSDDQRLLDSVGTANLPTVGHLLAATSPVPAPVVYPWYIGKIYVRAQSAGAQLEILVYEVDPVCQQ